MLLMPPWFTVPDSVVELCFDHPRYVAETSMVEPSITGHITYRDQGFIILDDKHVIPRNIVTMMTLLDPGVGWTPPKKEGTR